MSDDESRKTKATEASSDPTPDALESFLDPLIYLAFVYLLVWGFIMGVAQLLAHSQIGRLKTNATPANSDLPFKFGIVSLFGTTVSSESGSPRHALFGFFALASLAAVFVRASTNLSADMGLSLESANPCAGDSKHRGNDQRQRFFVVCFVVAAAAVALGGGFFVPYKPRASQQLNSNQQISNQQSQRQFQSDRDLYEDQF
jgi:hypothetical protein